MGVFLYLAFQILVLCHGLRLVDQSSCPTGSRLSHITSSGIHCRCNEPGYVMNPDQTRCVIPKDHGESCQNLDDVCNPKIESLSCRDSICQCSEPGHWDEKKSVCFNERYCAYHFSINLFYDPEIKNCVSGVGYKWDKKGLIDMGLNFSCPRNAAFVEGHNNDSRHGELGKVLRCECDANFTVFWDWKSCVPTRYKGESCSLEFTDRCDVKSRLVCGGDKDKDKWDCRCSKTDTWDPMRKICLIQPGQNCSDRRSQSFSGISMDECVTGAICSEPSGNISGKCTCGSSYIAVDGRCLKKHGIACQGQGECQSPNACVDGICACPYPIYQYYDPKIEACRSLPGLSCSSRTTQLCAENAECKNSVCECSTGFQKDSYGMCEPIKSYGENCTTGECDANLGLSCWEGVCRCVDPFLEFMKGTGCIATNGSPCGRLTPFGKCADSEKFCDYVVRCKSPSICTPSCEDGNCRARDRSSPARCTAIQ